MIQLSAELLKLPPCTVQRGAGVAEHGDKLVRNLGTAAMQLRGVGDGTDEVE